MEMKINLTLEEFQTCMERCSGKIVAIDTETTGLQWWSDRLTSVGFVCPQADLSGCIDIRDNPELQEDVRRVVNRCLGAGTKVVMHNSKFDLHFLRSDPEKQGWKMLDTAVMVHLIDSRMLKSMEKAEKTFLGTSSKREHIDDDSFGEAPEPLFGKKRGKLPVWDWNAEKRQVYCVNDCRVTYQLAEVLYPKLQELQLVKLFQKDMKYLSVLLRIERNGMLIDPEFIRKAEKALELHQQDLERQLYDACGSEFNWKSPKQLSYAIYEGLGIPKPVSPFLDTKTGKDKTKFVDRMMYNDTCTSTFLLMEKAKHPLGELISSLRESAKLRKTLQSWLEISDEENVVHTTFNLTGTRTGRLSSSKPNIQNVPSEVRSRFTAGVFSGGSLRTEEYNLRNAFISRPGYKFLSIDWKQMEMRMFGILSQDQYLLDALKSGVDIHMWIGKAVWGDGDDATNALHREWSKTVTFGLIYGMTTGGLQFKLNMTAERARKVAEDYWNRFPRIRPWMQEVIDECRNTGFVRYWSGRIWREEQEQFYYKSANAAIQGGCADLLSIIVLRVQKWLDSKEPGWGRIVNLIHDEIMIEVKEEALEQAAIEMSEIMTAEDVLGLPFFNDAKVGTSYGNSEKYVIKQSN